MKWLIAILLVSCIIMAGLGMPSTDVKHPLSVSLMRARREAKACGSDERGTAATATGTTRAPPVTGINARDGPPTLPN